MHRKKWSSSEFDSVAEQQAGTSAWMHECSIGLYRSTLAGGLWPEL